MQTKLFACLVLICAGCSSPVVRNSIAAGRAPVDQRVEILSDSWRLIGDFRAGQGSGNRPAVLMLNKANGDRRAYDGLAQELARRGISSLRLDLRGHGESINAGRFVPFDEANNEKIQLDNHVDVPASLLWLKTRRGVDPSKLAVVGASYSGELAVASARWQRSYVHAYALLSPGSLSLESAQGMDSSGARWMIVRSERETSRSVRVAADQVQAHARTAVIHIVDSDKHATDILADAPGFTEWLADWLVAALTS